MTKIQSQQRVSRWSIAVLLTVIIITVFAILPNYVSDRALRTTPMQVMATLDPTIASNLTTIPSSQPLTGIEAEKFQQLQAQVDVCNDYSEQRRRQVNQHIRWSLNPSTIPPDILIALGQNPPGRLVFGLAVYTSTEWRLLDRPANSCLVAVGRTLNEMLVSAGEAAFTIYDE